MMPLTTEEKIYHNKQKIVIYAKKNLILVIKNTIK